MRKYIIQFIIAAAVVGLIAAGLSYKNGQPRPPAAAKYNPFDNPHFNEDPLAAARPGSAAVDTKLKYDPYNDRYTYEEESAIPRYNQFSRQYEMAKPSDVLKYDLFNKQYTYEDPRAAPRYNPFTHKYEMATPDEKLKYDPFTNRYSYEHPEAVARYNPMTRAYEMARPSGDVLNDSSSTWAFEKNQKAFAK